MFSFVLFIFTKSNKFSTKQKEQSTAKQYLLNFYVLPNTIPGQHNLRNEDKYLNITTFLYNFQIHTKWIQKAKMKT